MSEKTASVHVSRILAKLGVDGRVEAAAVAHRLGPRGRLRLTCQPLFSAAFIAQNARAVASSTSAHSRTLARSTHSSTACAPAPSGPNTTVGMPAALMNAASIQALWPRTFGSRPSRAATCSRRSATIGSSGETSNGSRTSVVLPLSCAAAGAGGDEPLQLGVELRRVLARQRAPLDRQHAVLGVARQLLPARDQRGVHGAGAEQVVPAARERRARARRRRRAPGRSPRSRRRRGAAATRAPRARRRSPPTRRSPCARPRRRGSSARSRRRRRRARARAPPARRCSSAPRRRPR